MGFEPISDRSAGDCLTGFGYAADNERARWRVYKFYCGSTGSGEEN